MAHRSIRSATPFSLASPAIHRFCSPPGSPSLHPHTLVATGPPAQNSPSAERHFTDSGIAVKDWRLWFGFTGCWFAGMDPRVVFGL